MKGMKGNMKKKEKEGKKAWNEKRRKWEGQNEGKAGRKT